MAGPRRWRWQNVPLPEVHASLVAAGVILDLLWRRRITPTRSVRLLGAPLIVVGVVWAAWATRTAGRVDLERPERLVTRGPYAISRHPMYVAWTLIYLGVSLALNTVWLLILLPLLAVLIHREVEREEQRLVEAFEDEYLTYRVESARTCDAVRERLRSTCPALGGLNRRIGGVCDSRGSA